jgi:hypothetical protein
MCHLSVSQNVAEDSRILGQLRCVVENVFPDVSKDRNSLKRLRSLGLRN